MDLTTTYLGLPLAHPYMVGASPLAGTLDAAMALREEIAFFQAVKIVIAKATETDKKLTQDRKNAVLKQILDNAVVANGVEDIFKLAEIQPVELLPPHHNRLLDLAHQN